MLKLPSHSFRLASTFIKTTARPLDQRLFEFYFEQGTPDAVIAAVANYQNPDGGFGHAIEPDFRLISSSPMATTVAFQYLTEVNAHPDHPVVRAAIQYLLNTYDSARGLWPNLPPEVNSVPHAPWWHYTNPPTTFQPVCNAEIVACLNAYPALVPPQILDRVNYIALTTLVNLPDILEIHALLCYLRLAQEIPAPRDILILTKLRHAVPTLVTRDPAQWSTYSVKPLTLAPTPYSPLADLIDPADISANLNYEIQHQSPSGSWLPTWTWNQYLETWPEASLEWQGHLTVKTLHTLHAYNRFAL
ncbi:MAG: hypothetical protein NTU53_06305 [Planctomycetota bacterium]|nr:hypothetical protein [Planctomycetota bacterium]